MRFTLTLAVCLASASLGFAQRWEVGAGVGTGFYNSRDVTSAGGTAAAKIKSNIAASAWVGSAQNRWGGELRYDYQMGDLQLKGQGQEATFGAETHAIHYDFTWNGGSSESKARPFLAFGGGVKVYRGTGTEQAFQPLSRIALLTKTQDMTALVSVGAGVRWKLAPGIALRLEIHDYLTPFPKSVITPNVGSKIGGWWNDIVPMVGLSFVL
jgi:hypothetical protein